MGRKRNSAKKEKREKEGVASQKESDKPFKKGEEDGNDVTMEAEEDEQSEEDSDQELMADSDVDNMEKLSVDFEALPPHESDLIGLVNLVTQIFLRTDVDCEGLAKTIVERSPFGCVYKPTEECEDDDEGAEGLVYGTLSVVDLVGAEKYQTDVSNFILQKARKHAGKEMINQLQKLLSSTNSSEPTEQKRVGLVVNERMLHFPEQIAGPAFQSLSDDLQQMPEGERYEHVLLIVKVRVSDQSDAMNPSTSNGSPSLKVQPNKAGVQKKKNKKRMGKAEKKRIAAAKLAGADVIYDNAEEAFLFEARQITYFEYPVHSDVEKTSKFHSTMRDGLTYRPYRRAIVMKMDEFLEFASKITKAYS